jgi:surfactin synthase thioesterase subunit
VYPGKIHVIWGEDDDYFQRRDTYKDWKTVAMEVEQFVVAGGHHFLEETPEAILEYLPLP